MSSQTEQEGQYDLNGLKLHLTEILLYLICIRPQLNTVAKNSSYYLQDMASRSNYCVFN